MAIGVIMALSQQHLADEQRTILMSRAKVSGSITGPKINECMCLHEANILTDPTPHSLLDTESLSSISTFSASHTAIITKL